MKDATRGGEAMAQDESNDLVGSRSRSKLGNRPRRLEEANTWSSKEKSGRFAEIFENNDAFLG